MAVGLAARSLSFEPRGAPQVRRALLALGNVGLLAALGLLSARTARGGEALDELRARAGWSPLPLAIADEASRPPPCDPVTWLELDRPPPPPPAPPPVVATPPAPPALQLVMASQCDDPARSSLVLVGGDGQQRFLGLGDALDGLEVVEIAVVETEDERDGPDEREARVVLARGEERVTLRLRRVQP